MLVGTLSFGYGAYSSSSIPNPSPLVRKVHELSGEIHRAFPDYNKMGRGEYNPIDLEMATEYNTIVSDEKSRTEIHDYEKRNYHSRLGFGLGLVGVMCSFIIGACYLGKGELESVKEKILEDYAVSKKNDAEK